GPLPSDGPVHLYLRAVARGDPELLRRPADEQTGGGAQQQGSGGREGGLRAEVGRQAVEPPDLRPEPSEGCGSADHRSTPGDGDGLPSRVLQCLHLTTEEPNGMLWTAALRAGAFRYDGKQKVGYTIKEGETAIDVF